MRRTLTVILLTAAWVAVVWLSSSRGDISGSRGTIWQFLRGASVSSHSSISANRPLVGGGLFTAALAACVGCWACFTNTAARGSPPYSPHRRAPAAAFLDNRTTTRHYTSLSVPADCPAWIQPPGAPMGNSIRALATSRRKGASSTARSASGGQEDASSNTVGKRPGDDWEPLSGGVGGWEYRASLAPELQDALFHPTRNLLSNTTGTRDGLSWMAADVATSLQLAEGRFLWIFGDTLISKGADVGSWDRKGGVHAFPRQTLAEVRMRQSDGRFPPPDHIRFLWRQQNASSLPFSTSLSASETETIHIPGAPAPTLTTSSTTPIGEGPTALMKVVNFFDPSHLVVHPPSPTAPAPPVASKHHALSSEAVSSEKGNGNKSLVIDSTRPHGVDPTAALEVDEEGHAKAWYWVIGGIRHRLRGPLVLLASLVVRTKSNELGFAIRGTGALRVLNPDHDPSVWRYDQVRVPHTSETFNWFSGVTEWGKWALLVGVEGTGIGARQVLGRLPIKDLTDLDFSRMEVWGRQLSKDDEPPHAPQWMPMQRYIDSREGLSKKVDLVTLLDRSLGVTELTLLHDKRLGLWLMATLPAFENKVLLWTAPEPTGPWTRHVALDVEGTERAQEEQELDKLKAQLPPGSSVPPPKRRLFYAAKIHTELSSSDDLVFTYCANVLGDWPTPKDYTPRFFRLNFRRNTTRPSDGEL